MDFPWEDAARRAGQLAPAGPVDSREVLEEQVRALRQAAAHAPALVGDITGLDAAAQAAAAFPVYVVDRPGWSRANAQLLATLAVQAPAVEGMLASHMAAQEAGALLAALSTRVLGQFDPYGHPGRLLLVAPNIMSVQRRLNLDPEDFRLWVCLHELTHGLQFAAAPWLAGHLLERIQAITVALAAEESAGNRINMAVRALTDLARGQSAASGMLRAVLTPEELQELERITAIMSLLEGHADVVMDAVDRAHIPSVPRIRATFERHREGAGLLDRLLRRLTGLSEKLLQYREGAVFVRAVVDRAGHAGLNAVWDSPENLPTPKEIQEPQLWLDRVGP